MKIHSNTFLISLLVIGVCIYSQSAYIRNSNHTIRFEELSESIRSVYWYSQGRLYNTISRHVGWYAQLLTFYQVTGFSLFAAKWYKLFLYTLSLLALYPLLKPWCRQFTPLLIAIFGLSPTLLYFNTHGAQYAVDVLYTPLIAWVMMKASQSKAATRFGLTALLFCLITFSLLTYYISYVYLPAFITLFWVSQRKYMKSHPKLLVAALLGLCIPAFLLVYRLPNWSSLLSIQGKQHIKPGWETFITSVKVVFREAVIVGKGYNFELPSPEFSDYYPLVALLACLWLLFVSRSRFTRMDSLLLRLLTVTFFGNIILVNAMLETAVFPGLRRNTAALLSLYLLLPLATHVTLKTKKNVFLLQCVLLIMLGHHLSVMPENYRSLLQPSIFQYNLWFGRQIAPHPTEALSVLSRRLQSQDLYLSCTGDTHPEDVSQCRYAEIVGALGLDCLTHKRSCHRIFITDLISGEQKEADLSLWERQQVE